MDDDYTSPRLQELCGFLFARHKTPSNRGRGQVESNPYARLYTPHTTDRVAQIRRRDGRPSLACPLSFKGRGGRGASCWRLPGEGRWRWCVDDPFLGPAKRRERTVCAGVGRASSRWRAGPCEG